MLSQNLTRIILKLVTLLFIAYYTIVNRNHHLPSICWPLIRIQASYTVLRRQTCQSQWSNTIQTL